MKKFEKFTFLFVSVLVVIYTVFGFIPYLFSGEAEVYPVVGSLVVFIGLSYLLPLWHKKLW